MKEKMERRNGNLKKLKLRQKLKIKVKEIPALLRAKREEKKHLVSDKELSQEQHEFEKYALSMKKFILKRKKAGKRK
ncbi:MAG: hypothetical protein AABX98_01935 [Nanoarchaeota archaeon]